MELPVNFSTFGSEFSIHFLCLIWLQDVDPKSAGQPVFVPMSVLDWGTEPTKGKKNQTKTKHNTKTKTSDFDSFDSFLI